jgi:hypothetical protein
MKQQWGRLFEAKIVPQVGGCYSIMQEQERPFRWCPRQEGKVSVATVMTNVFQKNGIMVSRKLAKIVRIFVDRMHQKLRGNILA